MPDDPATDLRARLLDAALTIVDAQGAAGLTVRAVAKAAGCSTMGVYTHFDGKSGLFDAVVDWGLDARGAALMAACDTAGCGRAGLLASALAYRDWALDHPTVFRAMVMLGEHGYEPSAATRERTAEAFFAHRARVASAFANADADPSDWHDIAVGLWATMQGLVMIELAHESCAPDAAVVTDFSTAIESAIAGVAQPVAN